jgi:hypothetical protein
MVQKTIDRDRSLNILKEVYTAFNAREIDRVLARLHPDVDWPNGMEGGRVLGRESVRDYWTLQWAQIDPRVEPLSFAEAPDGRTVVTVHQVIRELNGQIVADRLVEHVYTMDGSGFITAMEIREPSTL